MYCTKCGANIAPGVKFCTKCGAPMGSAVKPQLPKPAEKEVVKAPLRPSGGRPKMGLILIVVGVIILIVAGLFILKPWDKEGGLFGGGDGVTPGVQKPAGVNFKTFEDDLTEATGIPAKFHVEYPDWTIGEGLIMKGYSQLGLKTKSECWIEIGAGGEGDTIEEAWQEVKEGLFEDFPGVTIINVEFDESQMAGIIEGDDAQGQIAGQPIHMLAKFVYIQVSEDEAGAIAVLVYSKADKWSEYEDIGRYVIDSAKIIKGPVSGVKVSEEVRGVQEGAYIKARDARRLSDISQFRAALEMYYVDHDDTYPASLDFLKGDYMTSIPSNPTPRTDGNCPDRDYIYQSLNDGQSYTIKYCLGVGSGGTSAGEHQLTPEGF